MYSGNSVKVWSPASCTAVKICEASLRWTPVHVRLKNGFQRLFFFQRQLLYWTTSRRLEAIFALKGLDLRPESGAESHRRIRSRFSMSAWGGAYALHMRKGGQGAHFKCFQVFSQMLSLQEPRLKRRRFKTPSHGDRSPADGAMRWGGCGLLCCTDVPCGFCSLH